MRLDKLIISNYRCFDALKIDLDPRLTVLAAPNGRGKTAVLDALRIAVWPFVKGFDLGSQWGKGATIQISDVRRAKGGDGSMEPQLPSRILVTGVWGETERPKTWVQTRERIKTRTNTLSDGGARELERFAAGLEDRARRGDAVTLPLIAYLGTSRLWYEGRITSAAKDVSLGDNEYSRTSGYLNCLSYTSSFKAFTAWFGWVFRGYREEQIKALETGAPLGEVGLRFKTVIDIVQQAVDALVSEATGWRTLEYSASHNQQLVMHNDEFGVLPVEMLSDGVRNAVAMVADLAYRAAKLNPHLGVEAAREARGIVMIDEVDMFLHPSWQQTILPSLRKAFPYIQFVVTTHSPQVLTTVQRNNVRSLERTAEGVWRAAAPEREIVGVESAVTLNDVMLVNPIPPVEQARWLADYTAMIESGTHETERGRKLRGELEATYGSRHPLMLDADRLIRFQAFKLRSRAGE